MSTSMYSGVAGMEAEQTKMDVIGNNIANVNTYGYKSQRAVFSDVYYQTLSAATRGTATKGGTNPSTVGVGSTLLGVQTMQKQSSFQSTSSGLDVAINGEGYLQVMDGSGNIFYTKAGMLGYDANTGYLVDMNGNFVLGDQGTTKGDGLQKIKLDNVGSVQAKAASATEDIDGTNFTISAQNASKAGNLSVNVISSDQMPIGQPVEATIANGTVTVTLNANEKFTSLDDLNTKINSALTVANGGKALDCG
ncbi:MAG: flagellar hook-basal body complex protein, partial [Oscillospiraceae bacterium]|nr:flagellar hook-basal body complex protein [Oscillospiraceae bacterium]